MSVNTSSSRCSTCGTTPKAGESLSRCSSCKEVSYCSKDCQRKDWTQHRGTCTGYDRKLHFPHLGAYFHCDNEDEAYERIIDSFRMRVEDDATWGGHYHGIMGQVNGKTDPLPDFEDYLDRAQTAVVLPHWWTAEKRQACIRRALDKTGSAYIGHAVEKSDIQDKYHNSMMPMELRMVAERIYGGGYGAGQKPMPNNYRCRCSFN